METTIADIQRALRTQVISVERLTQMYLQRIDAFDDAGPRINAYLHINDQARKQARQLAGIRAVIRSERGRARFPLFGVPVLLKDNIDTADMPTTAGSVALAGSIPPDDAFITKSSATPGPSSSVKPR